MGRIVTSSWGGGVVLGFVDNGVMEVILNRIELFETQICKTGKNSLF